MVSTMRRQGMGREEAEDVNWAAEGGQETSLLSQLYSYLAMWPQTVSSSLQA